MFDLCKTIERWRPEIQEDERASSFLCGVEWAANQATFVEAKNAYRPLVDRRLTHSLGLHIPHAVLNIHQESEGAVELIRAFWNRTRISLKHYQDSGFPGGEYYPNDENARAFARGVEHVLSSVNASLGNPIKFQ